MSGVTREMVNSEENEPRQGAISNLSNRSNYLEVAEAQAAVDINKLMANCDRTPEVLKAMKELIQAGRIAPAIEEKEQFIGEAPRQELSEFFMKQPPQFYYVLVPCLIGFLSLVLYTANFGSLMIYVSIIVLFGYLFSFLGAVHVNKIKEYLSVRKMESTKEMQAISDNTMTNMISSANALNRDRLDVVKNIVSIQKEVQIKKIETAKEMHSNELNTGKEIKVLEEHGKITRLELETASQNQIAQLKSQTELCLKDKDTQLQVKIKEIDKEMDIEKGHFKINQQKLQNERDIKIKTVESETEQKKQAMKVEKEKLIREAELRNSAEQKRMEVDAMTRKYDSDLAKCKTEAETKKEMEKEKTKRTQIEEENHTAREKSRNECILM